MTEPALTDIPMERFLSLITSLAHDLSQDRWRPDFIVGIGRGGLAPATWLSHRAGVPMLSIDLSTGVAAFGEDLLLLLAERAAGGERLLFVDDINDSGRTIAGVRRVLGEAGADDCRFAVLIDNITSMTRVDYRGEWIDRTVTKDWFVFPWEVRPL